MDYVLPGEAAGSYLEKARCRNMTVLCEEELMQMAGINKA
jgi:NAD-dependent DNA ligase